MDARVFRPPCISPSFSLNLARLLLSVSIVGVYTVIQVGIIRKGVVWFHSQPRSALGGWDPGGLRPHLRFGGHSVGYVSNQGGILTGVSIHLGLLFTPLTLAVSVAPQ